MGRCADPPRHLRSGREYELELANVRDRRRPSDPAKSSSSPTASAGTATAATTRKGDPPPEEAAGQREEEESPEEQDPHPSSRSLTTRDSSSASCARCWATTLRNDVVLAHLRGESDGLAVEAHTTLLRTEEGSFEAVEIGLNGLEPPTARCFFCCFSGDQPGHALPGFATQDGLSGHQEPPQGLSCSFLNRASQVRVLAGAPGCSFGSSA